MFSRKQIRQLIIPLMIEQFLTSLMGTADTMMVSTAGSAAISAVSLVDSINVLILYIFAAMAAGGTIVCAQYLGRGDKASASEAGKQMILSVSVIALVLTLIFMLLRGPILGLIFGEVETDVMINAKVYLLLTALSYPFIALYNAGAALFRVDGDSKLPMLVSTAANLFNIAMNAVFIFGFHMGAAGAALATLMSRIICGLVLVIRLARNDHTIVIRNYHTIRPKWDFIGKVCSVGIPTGIENGMFQLGKLAVQSTLSTLGTTAIAGHAMAASIELLTSNAQMGIGLGLMTIVGQCIGAGRRDEARRHIKSLTLLSFIATLVISLLFMAITRPITVWAGMESEAAELTIRMMIVITIVKPILWTQAYIPPYGMRAAGDVRYSMFVSTIVMWVCRVAGTIIMIRVLHWGIMSAWYGMFLDWAIKGTFFIRRFLSGKWLDHDVIREKTI